METKQETISRIRGLIKGNKQDSFLTDRFLYSLALKYAKVFIKRLDDQNKLARYNGLYQPFASELIEVNKTEASCSQITTCCTFMRTKDKLPELLNGSYGPVIRTVTAVDGSKPFIKTYAAQYVKMTNLTTFKYNKDLYYWLNNGYAYFPNIEWSEILFDAMWENSIEEYKCCAEDCCIDRLSESTNIPDFLFADIEGPVRNELLNMIQLPKDNLIDNQAIQRTDG